MNWNSKQYENYQLRKMLIISDLLSLDPKWESSYNCCVKIQHCIVVAINIGVLGTNLKCLNKRIDQATVLEQLRWLFKYPKQTCYHLLSKENIWLTSHLKKTI